MKKIIVFLGALVIIIMVIFYYSESNIVNMHTENQKNISNVAKDIREIAFDNLSQYQKDKVLGTWRDSKLTEVKLSLNMVMFSDESYIGKEVYLVDFPGKDKTMLHNNIIVFISMDNYKFIGYGLVD
ncbi:hypothetical protein CSC2_42580 [Clostridium zeae]|uniref:DUF4829 domain-containing protein n=1 Tax=Clostridium zeae TaxID=2759022 RepID=A0ABQ1EG70_9CLOT|nr:hypothetical protein [Clostridium zeae]GFZ33732.1 hypothetical protein CSC2_42580 [Clostridium zeae]